MARSTLPATIAAIGLLTTAHLVAVPAPATAAPCPATMNFAINGVDGNPAHVPGVPRGPRTNIRYNSSLHNVVTNGNGARRDGQRKLDAAARDFRRRCPNSHIRVYGNSFGALIAGNVRDQWNHDPVMSRNTSVVLVSDPRAPRGVMRLVPNLAPGLFAMQGPRPKSSKIPTATTCRSNDGVCNLPHPIADPYGFANSVHGYATGGHGYRSSEVRQAPGNTMLRGPVTVRPPAAAPAPRRSSSPTPSQTVGDVLPVQLVPVVPVEVQRINLPPTPRLPRLELPGVLR